MSRPERLGKDLRNKVLPDTWIAEVTIARLMHMTPPWHPPRSVACLVAPPGQAWHIWSHVERFRPSVILFTQRKIFDTLLVR